MRGILCLNDSFKLGPLIVLKVPEFSDMPYINIKITKDGATKEQKAKLIQGATQLVVDVLGKNPKTTMVVIDEVDTDNWGVGGESVTEMRKHG